MKSFTSGATNALEGRKLIPRTFSRRQALGLLGSSLAGASLLSLGLSAPAKAVAPYGIRGPAGYTIPQLRYVRNGSWYDLTLYWKCIFQPSVVNHTFETNWLLLEEDSNRNDYVTATVEPHPHSADSPKKRFIPSQANPSNPQEVSFKETIGWHADDLDTEIGNEEIFAYPRLGDATAFKGWSYAKSNVLNLSP